MKDKKVPFIVRLFDPRMWFLDFVKVTGAIPIICYFRVKRIYATPTGKRQRGMFRGKYLVAANHGTFFDPVILISALWWRRLTFVATKDLFELKYGKFFFGGIGCISVDKENVSLDTFKRVEETLNRGHLVGVFPEGGIVEEEENKAFKSGIVMMAVMSGADILPVYIAKRTSAWRRQVVVIGEKIKLKDYISSEFPTMEEMENLTAVLREKENELERAYLERQQKRQQKVRKK